MSPKRQGLLSACVRSAEIDRTHVAGYQTAVGNPHDQDPVRPPTARPRSPHRLKSTSLTRRADPNKGHRQSRVPHNKCLSANSKHVCSSDNHESKSKSTGLPVAKFVASMLNVKAPRGKVPHRLCRGLGKRCARHRLNTMVLLLIREACPCGAVLTPETRYESSVQPAQKYEDRRPARQH